MTDHSALAPPSRAAGRDGIYNGQTDKRSTRALGHSKGVQSQTQLVHAAMAIAHKWDAIVVFSVQDPIKFRQDFATCYGEDHPFLAYPDADLIKIVNGAVEAAQCAVRRTSRCNLVHCHWLSASTGIDTPADILGHNRTTCLDDVLVKSQALMKKWARAAGNGSNGWLGKLVAVGATEPRFAHTAIVAAMQSPAGFFMRLEQITRQHLRGAEDTKKTVESRSIRLYLPNIVFERKAALAVSSCPTMAPLLASVDKVDFSVNVRARLVQRTAEQRERQGEVGLSWARKAGLSDQIRQSVYISLRQSRIAVCM